MLVLCLSRLVVYFLTSADELPYHYSILHLQDFR